MSIVPKNEAQQPGSATVPAAPDQGVTGPYQKPELIEYGPLAKITQGAPGSTGESGNFTMRKCL